MKKIEVLIKPEKVRDVCEALHDMGIYGVVLSESRFIDNTIEDDSERLGDKVIVPPKITLVLTLPSSLVEPVIFTILSSLKLGDPEDGIITVSSIEKVIDSDDEEIEENLLHWYQLTK